MTLSDGLLFVFALRLIACVVLRYDPSNLWHSWRGAP